MEWNAVSVDGITNGGFTFYGSYPNPASTVSNIHFSLKNAAEVTVAVSDMNGKVISTSTQPYAAGSHTAVVETAGLAEGNYLCIIRTSQNDGIVNKITVIK